MIANFKSLSQSNIIFVVDPQKTTAPENRDFVDLFGSADSAGSQFVDDPVIRSKFMVIPRLKLRVTLENVRLRIDDDSKTAPGSSILIHEAVRIFSKLFKQSQPTAIGFNFDIMYRFEKMIPTDYLFKHFADEKMLKKGKLSDFGIQFALDREGGKSQEVVFLKVPSPLELAVHYNYHFPVRELWKEDKLQKQFEQSYEQIDEIIEHLKL
jgi:hypothetical protein